MHRFPVKSMLVPGLILLVLAACRAAPAPAVPLPLPPTPTLTPARLIGRPLNGGTPAVYRLMEDGRIRYISDWQTYLALGYQPADLLSVPDAQLRTYPVAAPLTRWITGASDHALYFLKNGRRYRIPDLATLAATGGDPYSVTVLSDSFLNSFPIADDVIPLAVINDIAASSTPHVLAALWANDIAYLATSSGGLTRWDLKSGKTDPLSISGQPVITALASNSGSVFAAGQDGTFWQIGSSGITQTATLAGSRITALAVGSDGLWYADSGYYDMPGGCYHQGRGLVHRTPAGAEQVFRLTTAEDDPLKNITALRLEPAAHRLWIGTRFSGLASLDLAALTWTRYTTFNSTIPDNRINDLSLSDSGTLWLATQAGLASFTSGEFRLLSIPDDVTGSGALAVQAAPGGNVWVSGDNFVGHLAPDGTLQITSAFDHPWLLDHFDRLLLDPQGNSWALGGLRYIHRSAQDWSAWDITSPEITRFTVPFASPGPAALDSISPLTDYKAWLLAWPRPPDDNGRGIHYLADPSSDALELSQNIARLKQLAIRWVVVNYTSRAQLLQMAPAFARAKIMVIWRPFVRPYREYAYWASDVAFLRSLNIPPYIQVYNEPSLGQEWEDTGKQVDQAIYLSHMVPAVMQVYRAGGFIGVQELEPGWLQTLLRQLKDQNQPDLFRRLFFIPHAYGYNHPPDYDSDLNSVLGFREFAQIFQQEIHFVPMMVAGEGGWRPGERQDSRYQLVTQTLHRDYLMSVFDWFRTSTLSNGQPLPDYFFAFCPWILSDPNDSAAWYDSPSGDRVLVIQAMQSGHSYTRKFSWDAP